jgi:hypothetical protein
MNRIADEHLPRRRLAHRLTKVTFADGIAGFYALHPIDIPRPPTGRTTATIRCRTCRQPIRCIVYSANAARRLRRRWFLLGCALIPISIVGLGAVVTALDGSASPTHPLADCTIWLAFTIGFLCVFGSFRRAWTDDGVRITPRRLTHSLREPGDIADPHYPY